MVAGVENDRGVTSPDSLAEGRDTNMLPHNVSRRVVKEDCAGSVTRRRIAGPIFPSLQAVKLPPVNSSGARTLLRSVSGDSPVSPATIVRNLLLYLKGFSMTHVCMCVNAIVTGALLKGNKDSPQRQLTRSLNTYIPVVLGKRQNTIVNPPQVYLHL